MEQLDLFAVVKVPLYRRHAIVAEALIDAVDAMDILPFQWHYLRAGNGYAYRPYGHSRDGTYVPILMHREIMGLPRYRDGQEVDHRNRQGLDNRRENLRVVTHAQNLQNTSARRGSTSAYRGVYWNAKEQRWYGQVKVQGHAYYIGRFTDEQEAARAVRAARLRLLPFSIES